MSTVKRRDNKNRVLRNGESQTKDGRYMYKYIDSNGKPNYVYSWRLVQTDVTPQGKKDKPPLRDLIKTINRDLDDGIYSKGGDMTVLELVKKYVSQKTGVRHNTEANYNFVINVIATVVVNDSVTREAITRKQERQFLEFIKNDKHYCTYYDGMFILFKTGLRISEFCGLTIADIDLQERKINVNHQLQRKRNMEYVIEETKTNAGTRLVPMTDEVYECFKRIIANRKKPKVEPMIDGKAGFLFLDKNDMPMVALHWEKYFQYALEKHNKIYREQLPKITPHVCRHTFRL